MYIVNWVQIFWDGYVGWQLIVQPQSGSDVQMNVTSAYMNVTNNLTTLSVDDWEVSVSGASFVATAGSTIRIADLAGAGDRPLWVDASGQIIEIPGGGGGGSFNITDDSAQTNPVASGETLEVVGRPGNSVVKTYFSDPLKLEVRLEWGAPGQVIGYDGDFGAGWVSGMLTYSDTITPIANSPLVVTHNWWTTKVQVSVYNTTTGEQVTPNVVSRDTNNVYITMATADEIEYVILWFI